MHFFDQMQNRAMQTQSIGEQDLERVENKYHSWKGKNKQMMSLNIS